MHIQSWLLIWDLTKVHAYWMYFKFSFFAFFSIFIFDVLFWLHVSNNCWEVVHQPKVRLIRFCGTGFRNEATVFQKWVNWSPACPLQLWLAWFFLTSCTDSVSQVCALPGYDAGEWEPGWKRWWVSQEPTRWWVNLALPSIIQGHYLAGIKSPA